MTAPAKDADFLQGKQVAFTGRLASMTRKEAAELVCAFGGRYVPGVNRQTSCLVVGQEGWPLRRDGRLTLKLHKAQSLQRRGHTLRVLSEEELLARLGLDGRSQEICRRYTTAELVQLLKVPRDRLRGWLEAGLIRPVECTHGIAYFDFRQVAGAKTLCALIKSGVQPRRLRRSLERLRAWAGDVELPLAQLAILEKDGALLLRVGDALADPTGQLLFDFGAGKEESVVAFSESRVTAEECFERACRHEDAGRLKEAETSYRQALVSGGPDPACCFNLANLLYATGRKPEAAERFYQAVEMEAGNPEAWNNLATVLADLNRFEEAKAAFLKAIALGYLDAHYNLADLLHEQGQSAEARPHWQAYLQHDQHSRWARYARSLLGKTS